jgi:uncharacterized iron-regulated membrane protein
MKLPVVLRKLHSWISVLIAAPLLVVIVTGLMIQFRKDSAWVQPTEQKGTGKEPKIGPEQILAACRGAEGAGVQSWADITRVDYRTGKGLVKVTTKDSVEVQLDAGTGAVLQVAYRRSDMINALHEGAWFGGWVKYFIFIPAAVALLFLWFSGLYLFVYPRWVKWNRKPPAKSPL